MADRKISDAEPMKASHSTALAERTALILIMAQAAQMGFMLEHPWPWKEVQQFQQHSPTKPGENFADSNAKPIGLRF